MTKADLWMPLYVGDYLAATRRLSTEQHGAYFLLMLDYWKNGPPPDDARVLAQITGLSLDAWGIAQAALKPFFEVRDGHWHQKRIDAELARASDNKARLAERAKKGAAARWGASGNASSNAQAKPDDCPSPSPSPKGIDADASTPKPRKRAERENSHDWSNPFPNEVPQQVWKDFLANRKRKKLGNTMTAWQRLHDDLDRISGATGWTHAALIEHAAARGWGGIYDPTERSNGNGRAGRNDDLPSLMSAADSLSPGLWERGSVEPRTHPDAGEQGAAPGSVGGSERRALPGPS